MSILQLVNLVLFWIFFGFLSSYIAKRKNRHPLAWFFIGLFLGVIGVLLALVIPKNHKQRSHKPPAPKFKERSDSWIKMWYYMDLSHVQQGPLEFPDLIEKWKEKGISEHSYVWGEGMKEWKKLSEIPELLQEIKQVQP